MSKKDRIPRGRDLFKDAMQMTESVTIAQNVSILPERPWTFAEVGRDWAMDTFAISHNAVRRELNDLYGLVVSMVKRKDAVNAEDINNFFVWWPPFAEFILDALLIDHQLVLPRWETRIALAGPVSSIKREQLLTEVQKTTDEISGKMKTFRSEDPKELLGKLINFVDVTVPKISAMFNMAENETVPLMLKHQDLVYNTEAFYDDVAAYAMQMKDPYMFVILWVRGFRSIKLQAEFKIRFLKSKKKKRFFGKAKNKAWFDGYDIAEKELARTHFAAVREFWRAWRLSEFFLDVREEDIKLPLPDKPILALVDVDVDVPIGDEKGNHVEEVEEEDEYEEEETDSED